jgi:hypothetical protein
VSAQPNKFLPLEGEVRWGWIKIGVECPGDKKSRLHGDGTFRALTDGERELDMRHFIATYLTLF